jgi:hypothetical protein
MVARCLAAGLVEGKNLGASKDGDWLWIFGLRGDSGYLSTFNPSTLSATALRAADGNDGKYKQTFSPVGSWVVARRETAQRAG